MNSRRWLMLCLSLIHMGLAVSQTHVPFKARPLPPHCLQTNPAPRRLPSGSPQVQSVPRRLSLPANQRLMGAYLTDSYDEENGQGFPHYPGPFRVGTVLPVRLFEKFNGSQIVQLRAAFTMPADEVTFFVAPVHADGTIGDNLCSRRLLQTSRGWNTVTINTPVTVSTEGLRGYCIGFDYVQKDTKSQGFYNMECYPLSFVNQGTMCPTLAYGDLGDGAQWYDLGSEQLGNLSVQCVVRNDNFPEKEVIISSLTLDATLCPSGNEPEATFAVENFGSQPIGEAAIAVSVDGQQVATFSRTLSPQRSDTLSCVLPETAVSAAGRHDIMAHVLSVDGAEPVSTTGMAAQHAPLAVYADADCLPRQSFLVEELTSQADPLASMSRRVMERLGTQGAEVSVVSIHTALPGNDQFSIPQGEALAQFLGLVSAPSAALNRVFLGTSQNDGYNGLAAFTGYEYNWGTVATRLYGLMDQRSLPALTALELSATGLDRHLDITVAGTGGGQSRQLLGDVAALTVLITEDGLVAPQTNRTSTDANYVHNHVLRSVLTPTEGDALDWQTDNHFENVYSLDLPDDWDAGQLNVVAYVHELPDTELTDLKKMRIVNASTTRPQLASAVGVVSSASATPVSVVGVDGVWRPSARRGVNIVRMSDGTVRKVLRAAQ